MSPCTSRSVRLESLLAPRASHVPYRKLWIGCLRRGRSSHCLGAAEGDDNE